MAFITIPEIMKKHAGVVSLGGIHHLANRGLPSKNNPKKSKWLKFVKIGKLRFFSFDEAFIARYMKWKIANPGKRVTDEVLAELEAYNENKNTIKRPIS